MAFEFDSTGGATPGVSTNYADPYGNLNDDKKLEVQDEASKAPNGIMLGGSGLFLNGSVTGKSSSSVGAPVMGWTNPQPGRLTH